MTGLHSSSGDDSNRWEGALSEERTHLLWRRVHGGLQARRRQVAARRFAGGLALAAVVLLGLLRIDPLSLWSEGAKGVVESAVTTGAILETEAAPMAMTIEDGSQLSMEAQSTVQLVSMSPRRVQLSLKKGTVSCDVSKRLSRTFSVLAGDVEVRVVGTKFSVHRGTSRADDGDEISKVSVVVERGVVEIFRNGQSQRVRRLEAGQTWSTEERVSSPGGDQDRRPVGDGAAPELRGEESSPASPRVLAEELPIAPGTAARGHVGAPVDLAKERFEAANLARRGGNAAEAARIYQQFLDEHAGDPRAGLAAFELGRLQMDSLGNPAAALRALRQALLLSPGASFREDVLARITQAYARTGQGKACIAARDAYRREFPGGVHRQELDSSCP